MGGLGPAVVCSHNIGRFAGTKTGQTPVFDASTVKKVVRALEIE